ncbi:MULTISPECIES: tRNA nucleotidyltransferase [unclassified Xanthobacter]|uniref:tRNA nucleotidyltransferase n=1 Tax=unclassified Xanthobacter TaxID=2623496 RepID=UPI001EDD6B2B|nr:MULTISPECIES: tRNA nucleotidyltransferase [unclassified Xanthobacter]
MEHDRPLLPPDLVQVHPGLGILRLAALLAEGGAADDDTLDLMFEQMEIGAFDGLAPAEMWPELARGLMATEPGTMIRALHDCGVLEIILPEVDTLFGVPQISDDPGEVDLGELLINALNEAARREAPLAVRVALLTMNVGKSDSPREHLPAHYRHMERGAPRITAICARFTLPVECRELALLALHECERVHRTSQVRAGPVAAMLARIGAFEQPARFEALMSVCTCDYFGHGGRQEAAYPKAALLHRALAACAGVSPDLGREARQEAQARAIAAAFRSERWSSTDDVASDDTPPDDA